MRRLPAVAGQFYAASPQALRAEVERHLAPAATSEAAPVAITPHAGLMYSGHVAGAVYARLTLPGTIILVGPNHTGLGPPISIYPAGTWLIPGAEIPVDRALAERILERVPDATADESAHRFEHCLEVQLPFLACRRPDLHIVPVVLGTTQPEVCRTVGVTLAALIRERAEADRSAPPLLLTTTDLTHYEADAVVRRKDARALAALEALDPESLVSEVRTHRISMCGLGPTVAALYAARALDADRASVIRYATSADVSGDHDRVVGYAGVIVPSSSGTA